MKYITKNIDDKIIEGFLMSVLENPCIDNDLKIKMIRELIMESDSKQIDFSNRVVTDLETMERIFLYSDNFDLRVKAGEWILKNTMGDFNG